MKKFFKKLWANRPFRTFLQGFFGVFAGVTFLDIQDLTFLKGLIISGIMAGLSAVMSLSKGEN